VSQHKVPNDSSRQVESLESSLLRAGGERQIAIAVWGIAKNCTPDPSLAWGGLKKEIIEGNEDISRAEKRGY